MNYKKVLRNLEKYKKSNEKAYHKCLFNFIIRLQKEEVTGNLIYKKLAVKIKNEQDRKTLLNIAEQEEIHEKTWQEYTKKKVKPNFLKVFLYIFLAKFLGYLFVIRFMERTEAETKHLENFIPYLQEHNPKIREIIMDEEKHEDILIEMLKKGKLKYVSSIVLGLNDALVEFTGALAGFTFAYLNNRLVVVTGLITGVAAALSMMSSEYFSSKTENKKSHAFIASLYTGVAYIATVLVLLIPYIFLPVHLNLLAVVLMLILAVGIIFLFNYYISVVEGFKFFKRFLEMVLISLGVAFISFILGVLIKHLIPIDVS